jgi:RNA polymerase sigma-70 factor (ECF subfamily)
LILWKKWEEYDPNRNFFSWACGVAHNEVRNMLRRNRRGGARLSDDVLEQIANVRPQADNLFEQRSRFLAKCLEKLVDMQRTLIERCYLGNESIKAIAAQLGISPAALTMRLQRIRKTLFQCVDSAVRVEEEKSP